MLIKIHLCYTAYFVTFVKMKKPQKKIDNANVMYWFYSEHEPIFEMPDSENKNKIKIHGLTICKYDSGDKVYKFSCNKNWEVVNDTLYDSIHEALNSTSLQYDIKTIKWVKYD